MQLLNTLLGLVELGIYRLSRQPVLNLCLFAGLAAAVGLLTSIPLYAEAAHNRLLQGQLTEDGVVLPPFSFVWRYVGSWREDVSLATYDEADAYLGGPVASTLALPLENGVRHVQTAKMQLYPDPDAGRFHDNRPLLWMAAGFLEGLQAEARLLEGTWPGAPTDAGTPVVVSRALAERLGVQPGERYLLFAGDVTIAVIIAGVWQPLDPSAPFWFYRPDAFDEVLLASEQGFREGIAPPLEHPVSLAVWYQRLDGSRIRPGDVAPFLRQVRAAEVHAAALLPGVSLPVSPVERLNRYRQDARELALLLTAFSLPLIGLLLYFISLIAALSVARGRQEIALLRSRGSSRLQISLLFLVQGLLLGLGGLGAGILLGPLIAGWMGRTLGFLRVDPAAASLPIVFTGTAWRYAALGVGLSLLALLLPARGAARQTIVQARHRGGRGQRGSWRRGALILLPLLPLAYGWYLLRQEGAVAHTGASFTNPLLFLVPALFCLQLALLLVGLLPGLAALLARVAERLPGVVFLLTLRNLSRRPGQYAGPLLLLGLTVSLAVFTASAARTLDDALLAQNYYQVGADVTLAELGTLDESGGGTGTRAAGETGPATAALGDYRFLPVEEHLQLDGVQAAARVGRYAALAQIGGQQRPGQLLALDRLTFPDVAYFRPDFAAGESLGGLMNRLGAGWNHLLVSRQFLVENNLGVGDPLPLVLSVDGEPFSVPFVVAGAVDLFPTYDPDGGPLFVANLDYVHERIGGLYHYDVWLDVAEGISGAHVAQQAQALGIGVLLAGDTRALIAAAQNRPARQGLFGLLSAGFITAGLLAVLGYLVHAVAGFRQQQVESGLLRALGVSVGQMALALVGGQVAQIGAGVVGGTVIGVAASRLFIPYLQVARALPALAVEIDWHSATLLNGLLASLLLLTLSILLVLLLRMRLFVAVKLGETV